MKAAYKLLLCCVCILFMMPSVAYGHAYIEQSTPAQESKLQEAPKEIRVKFTEDIDTTVSKLTLTNHSGQTMDTKQSAEDGRWLILTVPPLDNGEYRVSWQILSMDSHVTDGSFRFSIGTDLSSQRPSETISLDEPVEQTQPEKQPSKSNPDTLTTPKQEMKDKTNATPVPSNPPKVEDDSAVEEPSTHVNEPPAANEQMDVEQTIPEEEVNSVEKELIEKEYPLDKEALPNESSVVNASTIHETQTQDDHHYSGHSQDFNFNTMLRIIEIITAVITGGMISFRYGIWNLEQAPTWLSLSREKTVYIIGFLIFIFTGLFHLNLLVEQLGSQQSINDPAFWETFNVILTSTVIGTISWLRPVILILLLFVAYLPQLNKQSALMIRIVLILGLMVSFPYTGHAMSGDMVWGIPIISHTLHFLAAAVWIGGIAGIVYTSFHVIKNIDTLKHLNTLLKRFSAIAFPMVLLIAITGIVLAYLRLGAWSDLFQTEYGQFILWKTILFMVVLVIAPIHRYVFLPKLNAVGTLNSDKQPKFIPYLFWGIRIELLLAVIIILLAGFLSTTSPPQ